MTAILILSHGFQWAYIQTVTPPVESWAATIRPLSQRRANAPLTTFFGLPPIETLTDRERARDCDRGNRTIRGLQAIHRLVRSKPPPSAFWSNPEI